MYPKVCLKTIIEIIHFFFLQQITKFDASTNKYLEKNIIMADAIVILNNHDVSKR